jgi:hypothetical protein
MQTSMALMYEQARILHAATVIGLKNSHMIIIKQNISDDAKILVLCEEYPIYY